MTEVEFYATVYNGELGKAEKLIKDIYDFSGTQSGPFLRSKYAYLYACIFTLQRDYEKSDKLLLEVKEIEKDKGGWNLAKRLLSIINRIELGDYENAELKVLFDRDSYGVALGQAAVFL